MEYLATLGLLLAAYAGLWFVNTLMSIRNNLTQKGLSWDWKYFWTGVVKAVILVVAMGVGGFILAMIPSLLDMAGIQLEAGMASAVSVVGIGASVAGGLFTQAKKFRENVESTFNSDGIKLEVRDNFKVEAPVDPKKLFTTLKDYVKQKAEAEKSEVGGLGAVYSVPIDSYDAFRKTVNGKGYDIDGYYSYQCWDGAALLWQQIGRSLSTGGTGAAKGTWTVTSARTSNAGNDFELIYDIKNVKRGDVIVLGAGQYGHIAFADQDYNGTNTLSLLGQNQGGDGSGKPFNILNINCSSFVGAFRFKRWIIADPTPNPNPAPNPGPEVPNDKNFKVGDVVVPTKLVDYRGVSLKQWDANYTISEVRGDRAVLMARGAVWAAMNTANIKKV